MSKDMNRTTRPDSSAHFLNRTNSQGPSYFRQCNLCFPASDPCSVIHCTYSSLLIWKSPNFTRWCPWRDPQPRNMVFLKQTVRSRQWSVSQPSCFSFHSFWIWFSVNPRKLLGFWPLPLRRSCLRFEKRASLAFVNCLAVSILYCWPCSRIMSKLCSIGVRVPGSFLFVQSRQKLLSIAGFQCHATKR